mgnify:CR=1 FL=1
MGSIKENYEMMFTSYPDLVDITQLKEMLGIGITLAYRLVRNKTIKALKVGRQYKIPKRNVIAYFILLLFLLALGVGFRDPTPQKIYYLFFSIIHKPCHISYMFYRINFYLILLGLESFFNKFCSSIFFIYYLQ